VWWQVRDGILFIISDSRQRQRILRWNDTGCAKKQALIKTMQAEGEN